ncbi:MAG: hypothetical protein OXG39_16225 [Chloroflexi bacterium]|nr:hypothetical protein [Chloroflexota bacterium]
MIHITYAAEQKGLAEQIRDDLTGAFETAPPLLIVLVSAASNQDPVVAAEIARARQSGAQLLPILTENVTLPETLEYEKPLNFAAGYQRASLLRRLSQLTMTSREVRQANQRALLAIGAIAAVMFGLAIMGILSGLVAFPVAEYNEEATFQSLWIDGLIRETLEYVQPRSTDDARNFAATLEAAPTRLYYYVRGTATALPRTQGE